MKRLALLYLALAACTGGGETAQPDAVSVANEPLTGQTGALAVTAANTIVNQYGVLGANAAAGATVITVTNAGDFTATAPFTTGLAAGDLLMIYQPQGATIDATDTATYGSVTTLGSAGRYELVHVASVAGNAITLETACGGLDSAYTTAGATEVIRVPQLTTLTISGAGSITARAWDGARGGVAAVQAQTSATIGGAGIDVSGKGFRGGAADDVTTGPPGTTTIRSNMNATGAEKGESIAGYAAFYDSAFNGRYGRGAPANGGGGGDAHNGGGGGGANGNNGNAWTGAGVMTNVTGAAAWALDPDYLANGNARTNSAGGGRGGYTFSGTDQDALAVGPGNAAWGGDNRRDVGGLGGRPLVNDPATRVFLGGGGGAGDGNNQSAGPGGNGGGIVLLMAPAITGTAAIASNGAAGTSSSHNPGDAPGGGGAGGTVLISANALSGIAIHADGGVGGNQGLQAADEAEGPGGGGGGGFIATRGGTITATANGALGGVTNAPTVSEFPSDGATSGATGVANGAVGALNVCLTDDLTITNTDGKAAVVAGTANTYTVVVTNPGADVVAGATVTETFPATFTGVTWSCLATAGSTCPATGTGNINAQVTLANGGGKATFTIMGTVSPSATGNLAVTAAIAAPTGTTDPATGNNTATDTDTLTVTSDLAIAITDNPDPVATSGMETYTVTVTDLGPSTATGITVKNTLPAGATFVSATGTGWTCTQAGGVVTCSRPTLPPGAAPDIAIIATMPAAAGTVIDTATVSSTSTDPSMGNNTGMQMTTVSSPGADLAMALFDAPDPVAAGGNLTYTAAVTNNSAVTASMLTVTDVLPAGVTFVSANGPGWTCAQAGGTVTCTRPTLAMGAAPVIAIVVTAPNLATTLSNTASVAATTSDPTPGNNSATATTTVNAPPGADLAMALVDSPDPVVIGGVLSYTATVTNNSTTLAMTVTTTIALPTAFAIANVTGTGWGCTQAGQVVTCTRASLPMGAAPAIMVTGTAPTTPQTLTATANVAAVTNDPSMGNNTATATTTVITAADLSVAVSGAPDPVQPGGMETYTITVTDSGPGTATDVTVTFNIPPGATFVSAMGNGWTCTQAGGVVTCTRPTVPPGMAPPITIIITMPNSTGSVTATTTVGATTTDPMMGNNTTSTTSNVTPAAGSADLSIAVSALPSPVALGGNYTYAVLVTNNGPDAASSVTVTDTLPADVTFVSANGGASWSCLQTGVTVTCTTASLPTGVAPAISIAVVAPNTAETVTDTATVSATTTDPMLANNTATVMTLIGQAASADLAIALTDDGPVTTRKTLTYTATVKNLGPDAAQNLTVHMTLPSEITSVVAGTDWTCASASTLVTCKTTAVTAQPISVSVLAPAEAGTATATATVGSDTADPHLDNNTATDNAEVDSALTVRGGGCDAGGGSSGALVLLAVIALLKKKKLAALVMAVVPAIASAQSANFPVERMRISSDRDGLIGVEWADAMVPLTWDIGTWIGYADDPLVVEDRGTGDRAYSIVHRRIGGSLFGAVGITKWLEIGLEIPLIYNQKSDGAPTSVSDSPKFGDLRFMPKLTLRGGADRVDVAIMLGFSLESSTSGAYAGDNGATFQPELIVSRGYRHWRFSGNLGYVARKTVEFMDLRVDDELYLRAGAGYRFDSPVELDVTYNMATAAAKPFDQINTDPFELDAAVQWDASRDVTLFGLAGFGLGNGFGAPDWRVVAGLRFAWHKRPEAAPIFVDPDPDHDGITNDRDRCPNQPEDKDGFQDEDGCPDPDNDNDGIPDVTDKCPNEPEDMDGFQDTDGCPDPDNDQDGVMDKDDKCPLEPGPASNFGCPDPDRDGDGVPDRIDNCPDEPGPAENHGCAKKQMVVINNGKLDLVDRVYFRTDKDIIETRSFAILDNVANVLDAHPEITKIRVEGHTDNRGGKAHNQDLSQRRAAAVVKYLVAKKVARDRLEPQGFGQDKPIADNNTDTGRATNRRVEFVIVGGQGVDTQNTGPTDTIGH